MNTALAQLILTADYDGTFDECIDFGEEPSVDYQQIHVAELPYEPYAQGVERYKKLSTTPLNTLEQEYVANSSNQEVDELLRQERKNQIKADRAMVMKRWNAQMKEQEKQYSLLRRAWDARWDVHALIDRLIASDPTKVKPVLPPQTVHDGI